MGDNKIRELLAYSDRIVYATLLNDSGAVHRILCQDPEVLTGKNIYTFLLLCNACRHPLITRMLLCAYYGYVMPDITQYTAQHMCRAEYSKGRYFIELVQKLLFLELLDLQSEEVWQCIRDKKGGNKNDSLVNQCKAKMLRENRCSHPDLKALEAGVFFLRPTDKVLVEDLLLTCRNSMILCVVYSKVLEFVQAGGRVLFTSEANISLLDILFHPSEIGFSDAGAYVHHEKMIMVSQLIPGDHRQALRHFAHEAGHAAAAQGFGHYSKPYSCKNSQFLLRGTEKKKYRNPEKYIFLEALFKDVVVISLVQERLGIKSDSLKNISVLQDYIVAEEISARFVKQEIIKWYDQQVKPYVDLAMQKGENAVEALLFQVQWFTTIVFDGVQKGDYKKNKHTSEYAARVMELRVLPSLYQFMDIKFVELLFHHTFNHLDYVLDIPPPPPLEDEDMEILGVFTGNEVARRSGSENKDMDIEHQST